MKVDFLSMKVRFLAMKVDFLSTKVRFLSTKVDFLSTKVDFLTHESRAFSPNEGHVLPETSKTLSELPYPSSDSTHVP